MKRILLSQVPLVVYALLSVYFCAPLFERPDATGIEDWDSILFYHAAVLKSVLEYGQPPFWNPWHCGGNVLWQNPQAALLSPVYLLSLVVSLPLAMKLNVVLHYFASFLGMHLLLTRIFTLASLPVIFFLASLYTLAGAHALHLAGGHGTFLAFFYLPLLAFFLLRSMLTGRLREALYAGVVAAVAVYSGGLHAIAMAGLAFGFFAVVAATLRRDWRPLAVMAVFSVASALYAAPKLAPTAVFLSDERMVDTRPQVGEPEHPSTEVRLRAYLDPFQDRAYHFSPQRYDWHEYGNYLGTLGALAIPAALIWTVLMLRWSRQAWLTAALAAATLFVFVLSQGDFSRYAPFALLNKLPVFGSFRIPSRYTIVFTLFATMLLASIVSDSRAETRVGKRARFVCAAILILATCELAYRNRAHLAEAFTLRPLAHGFEIGRHANQLTYDTQTEPYGSSPALRALMDDRTLVGCYEPFRVRSSFDPLRDLVFAGEGARVDAISFGPSKIDFRVLVADERARVYLNQSYIRGWKSEAGDVTYDERLGLGYVELGRVQSGRFTFFFVPPGLVAGIVLFALGLVLSIVAWPISAGRSVRHSSWS